MDNLEKIKSKHVSVKTIVTKLITKCETLEANTAKTDLDSLLES